MIGTPRAVYTGHELKRLRQLAIRRLVLERPVGSQREVVDALTEQGFEVTQATVSRDITELGLHKAARADGHVYVVPEDPSAGLAGDNTVLVLFADEARLERWLGRFQDLAGLGAPRARDRRGNGTTPTPISR